MVSGSHDDPQAFLADALVERAAAERARARSVTQQLGLDQTMVGIATDLAERSAAVTIYTAGGGIVRGRLDGVGHDVISVLDDRHRSVFVALPHVSQIRTMPGTGRSSDARQPFHGQLMSSVLSTLAEERAMVTVATLAASSGDRTAGSATGQLISCGDDVIVLVDLESESELIYVAIATITSVVVHGI